jgi:antitoxin VapB
MDTAKLFSSGRSQAVRLPKAYRFEGDEVIVKRFGNGVLLLPKTDPWRLLEEALDEFEPDFHLERSQPDEQVRDVLTP